MTVACSALKAKEKGQCKNTYATRVFNAASYERWLMAVVVGFHCDVSHHLRASSARRAAWRQLRIPARVGARIRSCCHVGVVTRSVWRRSPVCAWLLDAAAAVVEPQWAARDRRRRGQQQRTAEWRRTALQPAQRLLPDGPALRLRGRIRRMERNLQVSACLVKVEYRALTRPQTPPPMLPPGNCYFKRPKSSAVRSLACNWIIAHSL